MRGIGNNVKQKLKLSKREVKDHNEETGTPQVSNSALISGSDQMVPLGVALLLLAFFAVGMPQVPSEPQTNQKPQLQISGFKSNCTFTPALSGLNLV